jgi:hypothetical protein
MRLDQFNAIAERIHGENPLDARTGLGIQRDFVTGHGECLAHDLQVTHKKRRVGLFGWTKILLDAEMDLQRAALKPQSAAGGEVRRFGQFRQAKQIAVESPRHRFTVSRHRNLDMVKCVDVHMPADG